MLGYIIKRILWLVPIMFGVLVISFLLRAITPGNPVDQILGETASEEQRIALEERLGLDHSLPEQFVNYVLGAAQGDLGISYITNAPVSQEIMQRVPTTLIICFGSVFIGLILGVPMGVLSAQKQYTWVDSVILVLSMFLRSIPGFCLALLAILIFAVQLRLLPAFGVSDPLGYILPMFTIGLGSMANYTRITRTSMLEVIRQDYVRTARAKGQKEGKIIWSHELRNAAIPIAASVGTQMGFMLGGALVIETVFGIPGIGKYLGDAVADRNYTAIQGGVVFLAFVFCLVNLFVDLSFIFINPRLKTSLVGNSSNNGFISKIIKKFKKEEVANG